MRLMIVLVLIGALAGSVSGDPLAVQDDSPANSMPDGSLSYGATFRVGAKSPLAITMLAGDESSHTIRIETVGQQGSNPSKEYGREYTIENSVLRFRGAVNLLYHVRPRIIRYTDEQITSRLKAWEQLPLASEREVRIEIRPASDTLAVWLDGKYAGSIAASGGLKRVSFTGGDDALVKDRAFVTALENNRFLPLEYGRVANPGAMQAATSSLQPGGQDVAGIPMFVSDAAHSGDIAEAKRMRGSWALECDDYLSRTSFDGMPESQIVSVPQRFYHRAWVLFAVDPDPKKDPILTVRLTRFAGRSRVGRGDAIADAYLNLPRDGQQPDDNIRQVGTVTLNQKDGSLEVPLYLAAVDIPLGEIFDLLSQEGQDSATELKIGPYLDFEILGRCGTVGPQWDERHKPTDAPSAANIFGVTLEKTPAELRLHSRQPGNIFHNDETPEMDASVIAYRTGTYQLQWMATDIDGTRVQSGSQMVNLQAGETAKHTIALQQKDVGHYDIAVTLKNEQHPFFSHTAAFALLPPDTRQAGLDSPYSVWWFGGSHLTTRDITQAGPLHLKAGIRRTVSRNYSEAEMAPYKMTVASLGWAFRTRDLDDFEAAKKRVSTQTTELLARYPSCNNAMIFHESHRNTIPDELIGMEPTFTKEEREDAERKVKLANLVGAFYREQFSQVKLIVGNTSGTAKLMADLFRFGFDPQYADFIGIETPGQSFMPEAISEHNIQAAWLAREVIRQQGHEIPMTGCHEFTYRADRLIGARRQAEHYVRDILISHAYGFKHIGPGTLEDAGGSYYNSLWGGAGLVRRAPLLYPKPSYVAIATATSVLDKATSTRLIPTGSLSVYALELKRDRQQPDWVYGTWAPRGSAGLQFAFGEATEAEVVDLYGRSRRIATGADHTLTVETGPAATYVIVSKPVQSITIASRDFRAEAPPATFKPADTMADVNAWELISDDDSLVDKFCKLGRFEMRGVDDSERGPCIELELKPDTSLSPLVSEYAVMRLREPAPLIGEPHSIGVWVKGNSNWGKVFFEFSDADGQLWRSNGGYNDWPADLAVNFDGWRFLQFFIDEQRSAMYSSPGRQWKTTGRNTTPKYPLHVTALYVTMHRQALDPVEMRDVVPALRFQNIGAYE